MITEWEIRDVRKKVDIEKYKSKKMQGSTNSLQECKDTRNSQTNI